LWRMVDDLEINGKDYFDAYQSLISGLEKYMDKFDKELHRKFMKLQLEKMQLWLKVLDHLA
jgi:hypothetical protein